jgi:hypothetical protein
VKTHPGLILAALAVLAAPAVADGVHVRLETPSVVVASNEEFNVDFVVFQADEPFNGFDASIRFDPSRVSYVTGTNQQGSLMTAACPNRFPFFATASDSLRITLVLLCAGTTVTGPGQLYRVRFKAGTTAGPTQLTLGPFTQFYNAGFPVTPLEAQNLEVCVDCPTGVDDLAAPAFAMAAPRPNPWSGSAPASFEFDLPAAGPVTLSLHDVSGRAVASRGPEWFGAGHHAFRLARPDAPAGIYFARLHTPHGSASRAVVLTR